MRLRSILRTSGGFAASLALLLVFASPVTRAQTADSEEISKLLTQAESHATLAADDAATLESYTRSRLTWQSHTAKLAEIAEHTNQLGKVNKQLNDLSLQGSPWQQKAIGQIDSLLRDTAAQLTATIKHLNDNQSKVHLQPYVDYAHGSYERARKTAQMVKDFVEYDKATATAEALEQKLELSEAEKVTKS
jgi:hypothetical protein